MIRTNLSTRPFYNVRAVRTGIALLAAIVLAFTLFNAIEIVRLSASQRSVGVDAAAAEEEAERLRTEAVRIRSQIDGEELERVAAAAAEANAIIDQRTFSFTRLLTQLETTLPPNVRVVAMRPRLERGGLFMVQLTIEARTIDDLNEFVQALEAIGAFQDVLPTRETTMENGVIEAIIEARYDQARSAAAGPAAGPEAQP